MPMNFQLPNADAIMQDMAAPDEDDSEKMEVPCDEVRVVDTDLYVKVFKEITPPGGPNSSDSESSTDISFNGVAIVTIDQEHKEDEMEDANADDADGDDAGFQ